MELVIGRSYTIDPNGQEWLWQGDRWDQGTGLEVFVDGVQIGPIDWEEIDDDIKPEGNSTFYLKPQSKLVIGPINGDLPTRSNTLRWPKDSIGTGTDYIFFQFGKYIPPFSREADALRTSRDEANSLANEGEGWKQDIQGTSARDFLVTNSNTAATYEMYNSSAENLKVEGSTIMLPMPQDLSNELNQQWQGKQFTATGRAATAALAAGQFSYASEVVKNIAGNATALQNAFNTTVLNSIPGVGGNLEFNDVSGSTRGIVINPNAELLYDAPEMREIGMIFKLVPRNAKEASDIKMIIRRFRSASMPRWGADPNNEKQLDFLAGASEVQAGKGEAEEAKSQLDIGGMDNWIQVPDLCKFTFMNGDRANDNIIQFKPCAISGVEVNYTPDGTYASYDKGVPAAIELRLNFMETKLVFADEVRMGY